MQVSVETLKDLERKLKVSLPAKTLEEKINTRLRELAHELNMPGFRPGKVPLDVVKKRFLHSVYPEVAEKLINETMREALNQVELELAGYPKISIESIELGKDFQYTATFEVLPKIEIKELSEGSIEIVNANVKEADIDNMLEKMREQHKIWEETARASIVGDKIIIDFEGYLDNNAIAAQKGKDYEIIIGEGNLIKEFEHGLKDKTKGSAFELLVPFPEDYHNKELSGKQVNFKIKVKQVLEAKLPQLDDSFAAKYSIKEGGLDALRKDVEKNMSRELTNWIKFLNKKTIFKKLIEFNDFILPSALIEEEIEQLKHQLFHRIFGPKHSDDEKRYDFPRSLFEEEARYNIRLRLLLEEYKKKHEVQVDPVRVEEIIAEYAAAYENEEEFYKQCKESWLEKIEQSVLEEMLAEKIIENVEKIEKIMDYDSVINAPEIKEKNNILNPSILKEIIKNMENGNVASK